MVDVFVLVFRIKIVKEIPTVTVNLKLVIRFVILMKIAKKMKFATPMVNAYRLVRECTQNAMETTLVITMKKHACPNVTVIKSVVKA